MNAQVVTQQEFTSEPGARCISQFVGLQNTANALLCDGSKMLHFVVI